MNNSKQRKRHRIAMKVSFDLPEGVSRDAAIEYVRDAIGSYRGSLKPPDRDPDDPDGDPMFNLDPSAILVTWPVRK